MFGGKFSSDQMCCKMFHDKPNKQRHLQRFDSAEAVEQFCDNNIREPIPPQVNVDSPKGPTTQHHVQDINQRTVRALRIFNSDEAVNEFM